MTAKTISLPNLAALALAAALIAGCSSTGYDKASDTASSLQKAAEGIDQSSNQVEAVLTALSDLANNPGADLKPQYKKFDTSVSTLFSTAEDVASAATGMKEKGNDYFKSWDEQLAQIKNEDIKHRSAERRLEVQKRFTDVKRSYLESSDAFKPFMSDLKDIRTVLSTDLTVGGVASIKGVAGKADKDAVPLRSALGKLSADFKALGVSMSPTTGGK